MKFQRSKGPASSLPVSPNDMISVINGNLNFKDGFFPKDKKDKTDAGATLRENLTAFEAGKAFFQIMKNKPVEGGKTFGEWFQNYTQGHGLVISSMKAAKHENEDLSALGDFADYESQCGYVFRVQVMTLNKPKGQTSQKEWDGAVKEFRTCINGLMQGKQ